MSVADLDTAREDHLTRVLTALREAATSCTTEEEAAGVAAQIRTFARRVRASWWTPYPWQRPHHHPPGWVSTRRPGRLTDPRPGLGVCDDRCLLLPLAVPGVHDAWLQRGGRGTGKTEGASHYVNSHAEGPACDPRVPGGHRFTIIGPTQADAVASCVSGVTGLQAINPQVDLTTGREGTTVRWPSGAVGRVIGAHSPRDVDRCRAWTNVCLAWVEEMAAMNYPGGLQHEGGDPGVLDQLPYTLRLGQQPHMVITTTPRPRPEVIRIMTRSEVQTWGRTRDAEQLPDAVRASLETEFGGTTMGTQELDGELIGDVEGALWVQTRTQQHVEDGDERPGIDNDRVAPGTVSWTPHGTVLISSRHGVEPNPEPPTDALVHCQRTVVGVDPAGGSTENGIVVVGEAAQQAYTLADLSMKGPPATWGRVAVLAAYEYGAVGIALERTYGGDQTEHVIETAAESLGLPTPVILQAPTPEGKKERAVPVQALSQVHRTHHVGYHARLETEQTTWVEEESESPNRLDAYVHAVRYLLLRTRPATTSTAGGQRRHRGTSAQWGGTARRRG